MRAKKLDLIAFCHIRRGAYIDHDLIHRHSPENRAAQATDKNLRTFSRQMPRIAIAVADPHRRDSGRLWRDKIPPIRNPMPRRKPARQSDA